MRKPERKHQTSPRHDPYTSCREIQVPVKVNIPYFFKNRIFYENPCSCRQGQQLFVYGVYEREMSTGRRVGGPIRKQNPSKPLES